MLQACNIFVAVGCFRNEFLAGRPSACDDPSDRVRVTAVPRSPMSDQRRRPVPTDPRVRALIAQATRRSRERSTDLSRRSFLLGAAGTAGAAALLAACGTGGSASPTAKAAQDDSSSDKLVRWANWTQYLDQNDDATEYPTLEAFEAKSGIKVNYAEDIEDNDSFYG